MANRFLGTGAIVLLGAFGFVLPGNALSLDLGGDGCFIGGDCSGFFEGGRYSATVTNPSSNSIFPMGSNEDFITGDTANGDGTTVVFTLTPDDGFFFRKLSLKNPETFAGFIDVDDSWNVTLGGASWTGTSINDGNIAGNFVGETASWTGVNPLATVFSVDANWEIESNASGSTPITLEINYNNLNTEIADADAFRIHVVATPEPLTILGASTAIGFGAFFRRKMPSGKSMTRSRSI